MRTKLFVGVAVAALSMPIMPAFAQSTGSVAAEEGEEVVVTGTRRDSGVGGVVAPDTSKAKGVLTSEFIQRQAPGQTINDTINNLPGVSFQNNDPFGSSGGTLTIRGFSSDRISQTFDGVPLNDSGNYQIYSNQQLDPELIDQVNVNFGATDVDSPTAGASGSTVNYRTRIPGRDFGIKAVGSIGDFDFGRGFLMIDTGDLTSSGTRAFVAASRAYNDAPFNNIGRINKQQYNARIYQPLGNGTDFLSLSGNWNQNRNNFGQSVPLRADSNRVVGPNSGDRFPLTTDERKYTIARCNVNLVARTGVADTANTCGSIFDERYNPSNTGNIRGSSKFSFGDKWTLFVDPSYQYVKANGGGTVVGQEVLRDVNPTGGNANCNTTANSATVSCQAGYIAGIPYFGRDLNGDGDTLDTVRVLAPSQTQTHRLGVISSLRYEFTPGQSVRLAYTWDRARHRQTGEVNFLQVNGKPTDVFPVNDPLADVTGAVLQKRDRLSYAILHQVSGEYRGEFMDDRLTVNLGIRAPFMKRNLNNYCATSSAGGFVECFAENTAGLNAYLAANPTQTVTRVGQATVSFATQGPQKRVFKYDKILPNVGLTFDLTSQVSVFGNFSQGIQVPGTDALYQSFYFPVGTAEAQPTPELTDNFDVGLRFRRSNVQAQASVWYTNYTNRLAVSYDPDLDRNIYRNLGKVKKYGFDGSFAWQPVRQLNTYVFGSYLKSEIQDDVQVGTVLIGGVGVPALAPTKGKREAGAPVYTFGLGLQWANEYFELGVNAKRTGRRFIYDTNEPVRAFIGGVAREVFSNKAPAYTLVDMNARLKLGWAGMGDDTYFQFNVLNVTNNLYVGGFQPSVNQGPTYANVGGVPTITNYGSAPNSQIGYPRTFIGSFVIGF